MTSMLLTFAEAEIIGIALHDRLVANDVTPPLARDDMAWADLVQFVMRQAAEAHAARKPL